MLVINHRLWGPILALALVGSVIGLFYEQQYPGALQPHAAVVGAVFGAVLGFPAGLFLQQQKRRWVAGAALALILIVAYAFGGPWDALLAAASAVIVYFVSAAVLRDLYGGDEMEAFSHHLRILFAARGGIMIVEDGKVTVPSSKGPHMGPMRVIVKPGNVVVMESGSRVTRICGPSVFQSGNFEYVKQVIDARRVRRSVHVKDVMTRNLVPIVADVTYVAGIDLSPETIRGENGSMIHPDKSQGLTATELAALRGILIRLPNWQDMVQEVVMAAIREILATERFNEAISSDNYGDLTNRIHTRVRTRLAGHGIRVESTQLTRVSPDPLLVEALASSESTKAREKAAGEAWQMAITAISLGYNIALRNGMRPEDIHRETQRFTMEHIAHDQATKIVMAADPNIQQPSSVIDGLVDEPLALPTPKMHADGAG
jgi:hypothetical protein